MKTDLTRRRVVSRKFCAGFESDALLFIMKKKFYRPTHSTVYIFCRLKKGNLLTILKAENLPFLHITFLFKNHVAELRAPVFQAALTVHDIDADSAMERPLLPEVHAGFQMMKRSVSGCMYVCK